MRVLITGGTGFIGSRLALKLLERGDSVRALGLENTPAEAGNRKLVEENGAEVTLGSVTDREMVFRVIQDVDCVYHFAAAQHEANAPDQKFRDINVTGTRNILEASVSAGVKRFVHASTIGVYGFSRHSPIHEESPLSPDNIYGVTKLEGEKLAQSFGDRVPIVIARISEAYGPGDRRLLKLFKTIHNGSFFVIGSGRNFHHLIYIDDLTDALVLAASTEQAVGKVIVLAGKEAVTTDTMAQVIAAQMGKTIPPLHLPLFPFLCLAYILEKSLGPLGIQPPIYRRRMDFFRKSFLFSNDTSSRVLGFAPRYDVVTGVAETYRWYTKMGYLQSNRPESLRAGPAPITADTAPRKDRTFREDRLMASQRQLAARMEPFDSFWQTPKNVEKGYGQFYQFYKANYAKYLPADKNAYILVVSCGPGYFVNFLNRHGYHNVTGIDSFPEKVTYAVAKNLNCKVAEAFPFLEETTEEWDLIVCEQELNHLTKEEMVTFLDLCHARLKNHGKLFVYGLNGANPITGAENLAHNFDHFNLFTEYSLKQVLEYTNYTDIKVIPLKLYVFYKNPLNYMLMALDAMYTLFFRFSFLLYGKSVKILTKKIGAVCVKRAKNGE
jgi:nucleoside-diphosphate-sugar epimerase/2-polyprenyl-3-methyl-5-hydroxy-6-metoxy-1,4-benzoquinol methylase